MSSRGKAKEKFAVFVPTEPAPPPSREIVPGRLNEEEWERLLGVSEGVELASLLVDEVFELAYSIVYAHYLEQQAFPYTVTQARHSLLQIIEWEFLVRDEGENNTLLDPSWTEDEEPLPSMVDSWARGVVQQASSTVLETDMPADPPLIIRDCPPPVVAGEEEEEEEGAGPSREASRPPTATSRLGSSIGYTIPSATTRKKASQRARPVARPPQARLVALPEPPTITVETASDDRRSYSQSSVRSTTPLSEDPAAQPRPPFPYGMKPVQLTWQKEVSYDHNGRIVDMVKLDPARFPSHLVRPVARVLQSPSEPTPPTSKTKRRVKGHQPRPLKGDPAPLTPSHYHTTEGQMRNVTKTNSEFLKRGLEGGGGKVQRSTEAVVARESRRFPELPALPALVDTIDPNPGVTVREAGRTLRGPSLHQRGPSSPRANLRHVQPAPEGATAPLTTGATAARDSRGGGRERVSVTCQ